MSCFPPSLVSPNRFDVLMEVVGEVIVLGVGWHDCQSFAYTPTPPTTFHSPHSPTTPFFPGRFIFPHVPGLHLHRHPLRGMFPTHAQGRGLFMFTRRDSALVFPTPRTREIVAVAWDSQVQESFHAQRLCVISLTDLWRCICFPLCVAVWCKLHSRTDYLGVFPML